MQAMARRGRDVLEVHEGQEVLLAHSYRVEGEVRKVRQVLVESLGRVGDTSLTEARRMAYRHRDLRDHQSLVLREVHRDRLGTLQEGRNLAHLACVEGIDHRVSTEEDGQRGLGVVADSEELDLGVVRPKSSTD